MTGSARTVPGDGERAGRPGHFGAAVRRAGRARRGGGRRGAGAGARPAAALRGGRHGAGAGGAAVRAPAGERFAAPGWRSRSTRSSRRRWTTSPTGTAPGHLLAPEIDAATLETVAGAIARCGGNIERIVRLAAYPVHSYELDGGGCRRRRPAAGAGRGGRPLPGRPRRAGGRAAPAGQAPDRAGRRLHLVAGRDDRSAGRAVRLRPRGGRGDRRPPWRERSTSPRRCARRVRLLAGLKEGDLEAVRDGIV